MAGEVAGTVARDAHPAHPLGMRWLAFFSAAVSLVVSFAAVAAPIPLYNIYRAEDGFTNAGISMAIVVAVSNIGSSVNNMWTTVKNAL